MRNLNVNVLSAADTASQTGIVIDANQLVSASFVASFGDATVSGTVKVQASNDVFNERYQPGNFTPTNWADIPNATFSVASGASGVILIPQMSFRWIRVVFTYSAGGSSTINVNMNALSV